MDLITILRTPRIFDMALFDWFSVLLSIYYINEYLVQKYQIKNRNQLDLIVLFIMIILGLFTHYKFNVKILIITRQSWNYTRVIIKS